jgi:serine/threonine protein kinase
MTAYENQTGRLAPQSLLQHRYLVVGLAGRGGMSAVYQTLDTRIGNRRVAVKEMSQGHLSGQELANATGRFQHEAKLLGSLQHQNLPRVYDAFSEQGRSYLVMEYLEGKTLLQILSENDARPIPVAQVVAYALQLCDVLAYLHQQDPPIIFRDLKPSNVIVTESGHIYLIDFGIARLFKEGQQQDTALLGSLGYAPPEQHGIAQTNQRSDLYALGATLHCCLTGKDPYSSGYQFVFPSIREYNPQVPVELDQLVQRLVAMDEQQRPTSAQEVHRELSKIHLQAAEYTMQIINPVQATTKPMQPTIAQNTVLPIYPPTIPVDVASPALKPSASLTQSVSHIASLWTRPFLTLFGLLFVLTIGGSTWAFNSIHGSDHIVEFSLSMLLLLVAIVAGTSLHRIISWSILFIVALAALISGSAFLVQATPDMQSALANILPIVSLNMLLTSGLALAAIASLFWLTRPFTWVDRILILIVFGAAIVCTFLQFPFQDGDVPKHILLLIGLITLIQGVLLVARMEQVRRATKP